MKRPRPKYQIFISSTFDDLRTERDAVTREILRLRHIPVGMEAFTATDDRGWKTILPLIEVTDYYVLIIAGRYGSIDLTTGKSWTQLEYEYAVEKKVPILAFIRHADDIKVANTDRGEGASEKQQRLREFIQLLCKNHHTEQWLTTEELARKVGAALSNHIHNDEDGDEPRPGWYRGDSILFSSRTVEEIARLSAENANLRQELETLRHSQGSNGKTVEIQRAIHYLEQNLIIENTNLYEIFQQLAPSLAVGMSDFEIGEHLSNSYGTARPSRIGWTSGNLPISAICSKLRIANLIRIVSEKKGKGSIQRITNECYLTDLGSAVAFHATLQQKIRSEESA